MKRVLWVPADSTKPARIVDLDTPSFVHYEGVKEGDPYRTGRMMHAHFGDTDTSPAWQEKVRTTFVDVYLMVDEEGLLKGLPSNLRATKFYPFPPGIVGDVLICKAPLKWDEEGPAETICDMDEFLTKKLVDRMRS